MKRKPTHNEKSDSAAASDSAMPAITAEERHAAIAQAAYLRAAAREFDGGSPLEDWLAAEAEFDASRHPA
jgi:Protein of unknown function (DUF2934)